MMNITLSAVSGILLALAFPKFNLHWLAWVALVPFFLALGRSKNWKEALLCGFAFGAVFFGIHLFWVTTLFRFVKWWISLGWVSLVFFQTLFILLFVVCAKVFLPGPRSGAGIFRVAGLAACWTFVEWLRAWGPFGVTGGDVGYSQAALLPLIQIASFASVYGISFMVVLANSSIALFISDLRRWQPLILTLALVLSATVYGYRVLSLTSHISHPSSPKMLVLLQPNIDQKDKMDPAKVQSIFDLHEEMTQKAMLEKPDIIIWPESAIFSYLLHDPPLLARTRKLAEESGAWLIFGTPHYIGRKAYNSIVSMSPAGEIVSRYDKQRPVPFGEYLPFRKILYPFLKGVGYYESDFSPGTSADLLRAGGFKIAGAVCFESTFPDLIRKQARKSADLILLVTNDAWFDDSSALYFHLNAGVFRAVENRKYFIQAANTGISAVIDPYGRTLKRSKVNQRQTLTFEL